MRASVRVTYLLPGNVIWDFRNETQEFQLLKCDLCVEQLTESRAPQSRFRTGVSWTKVYHISVQQARFFHVIFNIILISVLYSPK